MIRSLDRTAIDRFRDVLAQRLGLSFDDSKRDFLGEVLQKRIGATGVGDAFLYLQRVLSGPSLGAEIDALADELTVGETYFFRHPDQFRAFTEVALVPQIRSPASNSRLRILSAGRASGEEAYSLAIHLRKHIPDASGWDARVVGIDVNAAALAKAARAQYSGWSLRGMSEEIRQRYFRGDKVFLLDDSVRALVSFEQRNLVDDTADFWQPDQFDVIFCRNVVMYFTPEAASAVIARLSGSLVRGGFLFLGPAETLRGISQDFHLRHTHETFYYQRRLVEERPAAPTFDRPDVFPVLETNLPALAADDGSWIDAISQASERIARLSSGISVAAPVSQSAPNTQQDKTRPVPNEGGRFNLQAAREMVWQERFTDALGVLRALSGDEGEDPDAQLLRAVILTNSGQPAEAEQLCHQVLAGDELNAEAHYLLALCREHGKEYEAAIQQDRTAVYLDQQFAMPHLHLGLLRKRGGDWDGARRAFQQARNLLPREDTARILLFGGGFSREMLINLCEAESRACGGA